MYGDEWGAWCYGDMDVTVEPDGAVDGEGSCAWDLTALGYGTGVTYFYPMGVMDSDGSISGELFVDSGEWGTFDGTVEGFHSEDSTDLTMEFLWDWQYQTVVFERE
jgi:hypothetical protein